MHYSIAFRRRLCIAFADVHAAAFVEKPADSDVEKRSEFARDRAAAEWVSIAVVSAAYGTLVVIHPR